jgi:DNA-binding response OmpR family regulator
MRVLLVEDDAMIGAALVERLEDDAYAVDWVTDAPAALHSLDTHDYDVVQLSKREFGVLRAKLGADTIRNVRGVRWVAPRDARA